MFNSKLTYAEVGATQYEPLPAGYHHLHFATPIGTGTEVFAAAGRAVVTFALHRAAGLQIHTDAGRARPGVRLTAGIGPLTVPCQVVYTLDDDRRIGFGYGTLPGHQETGEEAFWVERDGGGQVWFRMIAFSRPVRWPVRLGGPLTDVFQRVYAWHLGRTLKRLAGASRTVGS